MSRARVSLAGTLREWKHLRSCLWLAAVRAGLATAELCSRGHCAAGRAAGCGREPGCGAGENRDEGMERTGIRVGENRDVGRERTRMRESFGMRGWESSGMRESSRMRDWRSRGMRESSKMRGWKAPGCGAADAAMLGSLRLPLIPASPGPSPAPHPSGN